MKKINRWLKSAFFPCEDNKNCPKILAGNFLFYYIVALLILKFVILPFNIYFVKSPFFADISQSILAELTNKERIALNMPALEENPELAEAAKLKAQDIMEKNYFAHQSPQGVTPWYWFKLVGYNYKFAGENLAIGFLDSGEVLQAWMESPSHKKNILNPNYQEIGIAVAKGNFQGNETTVVVQLFGAAQQKSEIIAISTKKNNQNSDLAKDNIAQSLAKTEPKTEVGLPASASLKAMQAGSEQKTVAGGPEEFLQPEGNKDVVAVNNIQSNGEVLSAYSQENDNHPLAFKLFYFLVSDYYNLAQRIIYGSLALMGGVLAISIFAKFGTWRKDLLFKTLGFAALFLFFIYLDKGSIIQLIPHSLIIY